MRGAALVSVQEYLSTTSKPVSEYINGVLRPRPMPTKLHALIQYLLVAMLRRQGVEALAEVSVRIAETRFLVPDVIADPFIEDPYPTKPVSLCVEILSPEDRLSSAFAKCEEYHAWGVSHCWVIDLVKQIAWEYHAQSDPARMDNTGTLHAGRLSVSLAALFSPGP